MRLPLRARLLFVIVIGVFVPMAVCLVFMIRAHRQNLESAFLRQGRTLANQIIVTRRWLSMHGGVYVFKSPSVRPSPYMENSETTTRSGDPISLRSPSLVSRELSELSEREGLSTFRIVSDKPINPANSPDDWETASLAAFREGSPETHDAPAESDQTWFRYMAPLRTEASCHKCHQESGYPVGSVRGGVSVRFPVGEVLAESRDKEKTLAAIMAFIGLAMMTLVAAGTRSVVLKPLSAISRAVGGVSAGDFESNLRRGANDELGDLAEAVIRMRSMVRDYGARLEKEVQARTAELESLKSRAQNERDFLINLFEKMADGICVLSSDGEKIEYINPSLRRTLGRSGDLERGDFLREAGLTEAGLAGGSGVEFFRSEIAGADGSRFFDVLATSLDDSDGDSGRLLVFRDITDRKRLEEKLIEANRDLEIKVRTQTDALLEQEKLAALGEVSAGLAHEIRNPLSAILSGIALIESRRRTPEEEDRIIKLIKKEARRLNSSLTDFLLFARPSRPKKVRLDLAGSVKEIVQLIEDDAEIKGGIEIVTELEDLPPVLFDADSLRQVIWNLSINAMESMNGEGRLIIRSRDPGGGRWVLELEDRGPGIPPEVSRKMFDPFFSTKRSGAGLGLSIVRRIVHSHGGEITHQNLENGGSRFTITAPVEAPDEPVEEEAL